MSVEKRRIKALIQRFFAPKARFVKQEMNGHSIILDLKDEWIRNNYLWQNIYEPETSKYIADNVKPGDVVYDIGAHIGYHSLNFVREGAEVHAFEPDNMTRKILDLNCSHLGVHIYPLAVSNEVGQVRFYRSRYGSAWSSIIPRREAIPVIVGCTTIDTQRPIAIHMIKIDVEGAEFQVLQGMEETLERFPDLKLIVEWLPKNRGEFEPILNLLSSWSVRLMDHNMLFY